jgi:hypothetical protein
MYHLATLESSRRQTSRQLTISPSRAKPRRYFELPRSFFSTGIQGCQMVCFQTKNPNFGKIWRALEWKMLLYFLTVCNILRPFGIIIYASYSLWWLGIFFTFWHVWTKKHLATLRGSVRPFPAFCKSFGCFKLHEMTRYIGIICSCFV